MNRPLLSIALLAPVVALAQNAPAAKVPAVQPKITVLGEIRDTTLDASLMPQDVVRELSEQCRNAAIEPVQRLHLGVV